MAFDWGTDISQAVEDAIGRLPDYNSGNFNAGTNPQGLGAGGHITNFPAALDDMAILAASGLPPFANLMEGYANAAATSASDAASAVANLSGTSTSSVALSTGSKSFSTQAGKTWPAGTLLLLSSDANPTTHWMVIQVTSYVTTTLQGDVKLFSGSGSRADWTFRVAGYPGRAAGAAYLWSTNTANSDPTTGKLKMNATPASANALYISETDFDGNALGTWLATWDDSTSTTKGRLIIQQITQPQNFAIVDISGTLTDNGTWDTFSITNVASGGTLADGAIVSILYLPQGNIGSTGPTGASYAATSSSSLAIGTGSKAFTTQSGLAYQAGARVRATDSGNNANWMEGVVTSYVGTTLTVNVDLTSGSGTIASWLINIAGERGAQGTTGASGDDAGLEFVFNTATSGDPATGKFLFNNATFTSATQINISETDNNGNAIAALLAAIDNGSGTNKILVLAVKQGGAAYFSFYVTSVLTDNGTYDTFNISPISTSGSIINGDTFHIILIPLEKGDTGSTGSAGPTTAPTWLFDAGTADADPGTNEFALNNATIGSVTKAFINDTGPGSADMSAYLASWDDSTNSTHRGTLYIIQANDPTKYAIFTVGTVTDDGAYFDVALTYVAGPGGFTAAAQCAFAFTRSGNAGAGSGDVVGPASAVNNGIALYDGTTGKLLKDGGAVGALATLSTVGTTQIDDNAVTYAKMQNVSTTDRLLGRQSGGPGDVEEITCTAAGRALIDDASAGDQKTTLGLGNVDNTSDANKPISTATQAVLDIKKYVSVRAATTGNITIATALNNADNLDGVTLATGDLVLVKDQSSAAENGIYVVGVSPARHGQYDAYNDHPGATISVQEGTANADTHWHCTSNTGGTIDSTALDFAQLDITPYTAGATLTLSGHQFSLNLNQANIWTAAQTFINSSGILIQDTNASHTLGIILGSDLTANRTLTITPGDASRSITLGGNISTAGALTLSGAFGATFTFTGTTTVTFPTTGTLATTSDFTGKQKIPLPADSWLPATTNGPALGTTTGTNNERRSASFDPSTQETMFLAMPMPAQWDESTITFDYEWEHPATATNFGVAFGLSAVAIGDNESGDPAFGTEVIVTDTGGTTNNNYKSAESAAVTAAGTIASGDLLMLRFRRVPTDGGDTLAVDARVKSVNVYINTAAGHD